MDFIEILIRILLLVAGAGLFEASSQLFGQLQYFAGFIIGFLGLMCVFIAFYHIRKTSVDTRTDETSDHDASG